MLEDLANVLFSLSFKSTSHSMGLCYFFFLIFKFIIFFFLLLLMYNELASDAP